MIHFPADEKPQHVIETVAADLHDARLTAQRPHGVAFLRAMQMLYKLSSIEYVCLNVPSPAPKRGFCHFAFSDSDIRQWASADRLEIEVGAGFAGRGAAPERGLETVLPLLSYIGECAALALRPRDQGAENGNFAAEQIALLGRCFHQHVLRMLGHNLTNQRLLATREVDCLKCAADGKSAQETSIILGITERTVRFHLNSARTKLRCRTTTQAVAKAVSENMI